MSRAARRLARALVVIWALGLLLVGVPAALAAPGELDSGFASGGSFTGSFETEPKQHKHDRWERARGGGRGER